MIENPLSDGIAHVADQFSELKFNFSGFLPSLITAGVLIIVLAILIILWPYGLVAIMEDLVRGLMHKTREKMKGLTVIAKMPFSVALGIYFLVWLPFAFLCLPIVIVGAIGHLFSE